MKLVLINSTDTQNTLLLQKCFEGNYIVEAEKSEVNFIDHFKQKKYDYLFIDFLFLFKDAGKNNYSEILRKYWEIFPDTEIILLTPQQNIREAIEFVKVGASDYITMPLVENDINYIIQRVEEKTRMVSELNYLRESVSSESANYLLHTQSEKMQNLFRDLRSVSQTDSTVLITGETGTGKGIVARLIHQAGNRKENQFIAVHCGAIPDSLLESELFGHEKGAFTGAVRRKLGKFEIAEGGTIFLDEIGTISPAMQIKLLEVLQEKMFYRVGGESVIRVNVRIIAATNSNLAELAEQDVFRKDLFYRLNVFQLEVPALRERKEDIEALAWHLLFRFNKNSLKNIKDIHPEVLNAFNDYTWPGNIRELENLIERAYILETTSMLTPKSFPVKLFKEKLKKYIQPVDTTLSLEEMREKEIARIEQEYISELLIKFKGRVQETATAACISTRQLNNLMRKYNLEKKYYKKIK